MGTPRQIVLLCAEEDDLGLVGVVHLGRQLGLQLQVITELECDDGPFLDAINGCDSGLFAIVRSPHLDEGRAAQLAATFELARIEGLELVELTLHSSAEQTLRPALALLQDLDDWEPPKLGNDLVTGRFTPAALPAIPDSGLGPILLSDPAFEREANTAASLDVESTGRLEAFPMPLEAATLDLPTRGRGSAIAVVAACLALLAAGAWWQWQLRAAPSQPPAANAEVRVVEAAAVPADEDDLAHQAAAEDSPEADPTETDPTPTADRARSRTKKRRRRRRN